MPERERRRVQAVLRKFDDPLPRLNPTADFPVIRSHWAFFDLPHVRKKLMEAAERNGVGELIANLELHEVADLDEVRLEFALLPGERGLAVPQRLAVTASRKVRAGTLGALTEEEKAVVRGRLKWFRRAIEKHLSAGGGEPEHAETVYARCD